MELMQLSAGRASLEFKPSEGAVIVEFLEGLGLERKPGADADMEIWSVGAHSFIALYEWGEPCLIAQDVGSSAFLEDIVGSLAQHERRQQKMVA